MFNKKIWMKIEKKLRLLFNLVIICSNVTSNNLKVYWVLHDFLVVWVWGSLLKTNIFMCAFRTDPQPNQFVCKENKFIQQLHVICHAFSVVPAYYFLKLLSDGLKHNYSELTPVVSKNS